MIELSERELKRLLKEKQRQKREFSKGIVTLVILLNTIFAAAVLYVFLKTNGSEPTALITAWFGFTTGELWFLSKITREKKAREHGEAINPEVAE